MFFKNKDTDRFKTKDIKRYAIILNTKPKKLK